MPIHVTCEECGAKFRVDERRAGTVLPCKHCGAEMEVPGGRRAGANSRRSSASKGVAWPVWAGVGGGIVVLAVVLFVIFAGGDDSDSPRRRRPPQQITGPRAVQPQTGGYDHEARQRQAMAEEQERKLREAAEREQNQQRYAWAGQVKEVQELRVKALRVLVEPLQTALTKTALAAFEARDEDRNDRLREERNAFSTDRLALPESPEVRREALEYVTQRLAIEQGFLQQLTDLHGRMPDGISSRDHEARLLNDELDEVTQALAKLEAAERKLAGLPTTAAPTTVAATTPQPNSKSPSPGNPMPMPVPTTPTAEPVAGWGLTVDPPPEKVEFPADLVYELPTGSPLFPYGRATFLGIGSTAGSRTNIEQLTVYDLRTGQQIGQAGGFRANPVSQISLRGLALSPDGTFLAMEIGEGIAVGDVRTQKPVASLEFAEAELITFPAADRVLAFEFPSSGGRAKLWSLPDGKLVREFTVIPDDPPDPGRLAFSPGGRYMAIGLRDRVEELHFYDLTTGEKVGSVVPPERTSTSEPWFLSAAFSPDGEEFAAVAFGAPNRGNIGALNQVLYCWDVRTGKVVYQAPLNTLGRGLLGGLAREPLQWFPDRQGWLLWQRFVFDRRSSQFADELKPHAANVVLDDTHVLTYATETEPKIRDFFRPQAVKRQP